MVGEGTPQDPEPGGERKFEEGGGLSLSLSLLPPPVCSPSVALHMNLWRIVNPVKGGGPSYVQGCHLPAPLPEKNAI